MLIDLKRLGSIADEVSASFDEGEIGRIMSACGISNVPCSQNTKEELGPMVEAIKQRSGAPA